MGAVEALAARGAAALPVVARAFVEGGLLVRLAALEVLERLALPETAPMVERLLSDPGLRERATEVLERLRGGSEIEAVTRRARGGDVRSLRELIACPDPDRIPRLCGILEAHLPHLKNGGRSPLTLEEIVIALGIRGEDRAVAVLEQALSAPHRPVAARALGRIGTPRAVEALGGGSWGAPCEGMQARVEALTGFGERGAALLTRQLKELGPHLRPVCAALERMGPAAVPPLCDLARSGSLFGADDAIELLGRIGDRRALSVLTAIALSEAAPWHRDLACTVLGKLGHPESAPVIASVLGSRIATSRRVLACAALAKLRDPEALPGLREALCDPSRTLQAAAAAALVDLGESDPGLIPILIEGLVTDEETLGRDSARALGVLAERTPDIRLRAALTRLRWLATSWLTQREHRGVYRAAIERILAATDSRSRLPLPASSPTENLPLPSSAPERRGTD